jgi:hypothetical protein
MFSFPRPGCVQTGEPGYAYVFDAKSGESYIFLRNLAVGLQSNVQLVANISTKEIVVRKVSKHTTPLDAVASTLTSVPEDHEVCILDHINSLIRNPSHAFPAFTPRLAICLSHEAITVMSDGPQPRMEWMHVSYWKMCNAGTLGEWIRSWTNGSGTRSLPVSLLARSIAQVSQTLHIMYHAGPEPVYHCDLHIDNIFVHFDDPSDPACLPDFYIGDFGWSCIAIKADADGLVLHGSNNSNNSTDNRNNNNNTGPTSHPNPSSFTQDTFRTAPSPGPDTPPTLQRYQWDITRLLQSLDVHVDPSSPDSPNTDPAAGLWRLMEMIRYLNAQELRLAATNPRSRPASLVEVVREAQTLETVALAAEQGSESFQGFMECRKAMAREIMAGGKPYVFSGTRGGREMAERFGRESIDGFGRVVESV